MKEKKCWSILKNLEFMCAANILKNVWTTYVQNGSLKKYSKGAI